jgi:hypothetical protein
MKAKQNWIQIRLLGAVLLLLVAFGTSSLAQTTTFVVNQFDDSSEVVPAAGFPWAGFGQGWGNWFGGAFQSATWDSSDASNNLASGSMKIVANFSPNDYGQYVVYDGFSAFSLNAQQYTNLQFDIRFDQNSTPRMNHDGSLDFGLIQVGIARQDWSQDYFYSFAVPATNSLGQPNTNWVHISITLDPRRDLNLTNITDVIFHTINGYYGNTYNGTQTYWLDNIKFVGPSVPASSPPPVMAIQRATPGLRLFAGDTSANYNREEIATLSSNVSWYGSSSFPVTYSFTINNFPGFTYQAFQFHMFLIPQSAMQWGPADSYADWNCTNDIFLRIWFNPRVYPGTNQYAAEFMWKTNSPGANYTAMAAAVLTPTAVGKWTVAFNNNTSVTLTTPAGTSTNFNIPSEVAAKFNGPVYAYFGIQPNSDNGEDQFVDLAKIQITGIGSPVNDTFTTDTGLNTATWKNVAYQYSSVCLVPVSSPYWINWSLPDAGFDLGTASHLTNAETQWVNPGYFSKYNDSLDVRHVDVQQWALIPSDCLPSGSNSFFRLMNPPISSIGFNVFQDNFDPQTASAITSYLAGDATNVAIGVFFGIGTGGSSALQIKGSVNNGPNGYGVMAAQWQDQSVSGNTDTNLSDYVLSFDAYVAGDALHQSGGGFQLTLQETADQYFGSPFPQGTLQAYQAYQGGSDLLVPQSGVWKHFDINLGGPTFKSPNGYNSNFNPTGGTWQIIFQLNSGDWGSEPQTGTTLIIDNLILTDLTPP